MYGLGVGTLDLGLEIRVLRFGMLDLGLGAVECCQSPSKELMHALFGDWALRILGSTTACRDGMPRYGLIPTP